MTTVFGIFTPFVASEGAQHIKQGARRRHDHRPQAKRPHSRTSRCQCDNVTDDSTFPQRGADSLDKIEIIMACEEEFETIITDPDADQLNTVADAIAYVKARTA